MAEQALEDLLSERPDRLWARPTPSRTGQEGDETAIFAAVGHALSTWEAVESAQARLYLMFAEVNNSASINVIQRTYGTIGFNSGRRQTVQFAAELYFGEHWNKAKIELNRLLSHVDHASQRRDDIAHGQVIGILSTMSDGRSGPAADFLLIPPDYNSRFNFATIAAAREVEPSQIHKGKYSYTTSSIDFISAKFRFLRDALYQYMDIFEKEHGQLTVISLERLGKSRK